MTATRFDGHATTTFTTVRVERFFDCVVFETDDRLRAFLPETLATGLGQALLDTAAAENGAAIVIAPPPSAIVDPEPVAEFGSTRVEMFFGHVVIEAEDGARMLLPANMAAALGAALLDTVTAENGAASVIAPVLEDAS